jgi:hypothetical protein
MRLGVPDAQRVTVAMGHPSDRRWFGADTSNKIKTGQSPGSTPAGVSSGGRQQTGEGHSTCGSLSRCFANAENIAEMQRDPLNSTREIVLPRNLSQTREARVETLRGDSRHPHV